MVQEYTGEIIPVSEYTGEVVPIKAQTRPTAADIPDDKGNKVVPPTPKEATLTEKIVSPFEAAVDLGGSMVSSIIGQIAGVGAGVLTGDLGKAGGAGERTAEKVTDFLSPKTTNPAAQGIEESADVVMRESGMTALMPGMHPEVPSMGAGAGRFVKDKALGSVLEKVEKKTVSPEYEKSKIKPDESISDAIKRKNETGKLQQTAFINKETGEIEPSGPKHDDAKKAEPDKYEAGFVDSEGKFRTRKEAESIAKENGQIGKDQPLEKPEEGLHSGDLRTAGEEQFSLTPKDPSMDAAEEVMSQEAATSTIKDSMREIRADDHQADIFSKRVEEAVSDPRIRDRMTRAAEAEKPYDKIMTDKEKHEVLNGTGKENKHGFIDTGLKGSSDRMKANLARGKLPEGETPEGYATRIAKLDNVIAHLESLPSEEHAIPILKEVQDYFLKIGEKAKSAGLIDSLRDNYVTHVLDWSKFKGDEKAKQAILDRIRNEPKDSKLVKDFTQQRKYEFLRELEKQVEGTGVVVHTDIAKITQAYGKSMQQAIVHQKMIDVLKTSKAGELGHWIEPTSAEALKKGYVPFQGKGSMALDGMLVHPDLKDAMGHMFNQDNPGLALRAAGAISHLTKTLNTIGSFFHAYNLGTAHMMTDPLHALKELSTGGAGVRKAVDAFKHEGKDTAYGKLIDDFMRNGLMIGTEDVKRTALADAGVTVDKLISRFAPEGFDFKILQHATDPLDKQILQRMNTFTWDYMHTGQKINLATHLYEKMMAKNPEMPREQAMKEISGYINNTFGGLDWLEVASQVENKYMQAFAMKAMNMRGRTWGQVVLFAPDWTVSTVRAMTTALPKELAKPQNWKLKEGVKGVYNPKTQGDLARRYVLHTGIAYLTLLNGINMAMSGHPIWDNKDPTRIDLGDGTSMQPAKHSMEAAEWVRDPAKTFGNKLGILPKATFIEISGRAYPSPDAPKIKPMWNGYGGMEAGKARAIALSASPFQLSSGIQAPEGEGWKRAMMSAAGIPVYGQTHEEHKKSVAEGKLKKKEQSLEELRNR